MSNNTLKQLKNGVFWSSVSSGAVSGVSLLRLLILARLLDSSDFGILALVTVVIGFTSLYVDLGLTSAVLHKKTISKSEFSGVYWSSVMLGLTAYLTMFVLAETIAKAYDEILLEKIIPLMGINIILLSLGRQYNNLEVKYMNFKFISFVEILSAMISLASAVIFAFNGLGVLSLVYSQVLATLVGTILFIVNGFGKRMSPFKMFKLSEIRPFFRIGFYNSVGQTINFLNKEMDIILFGKFVSIETLGIYNLIKQLVLKPSAIISPIVVKVAIPILSKLQENRSELKQSFLIIVSSVAAINTVIYGVLILFTPLILRIAFGSGFENQVYLGRVIILYVYFMSLRSPMGTLTIASGQTKYEMHWALLNSAVVLPTLYCSLHIFDIPGVLLALSMAVLLLYYGMWRLVIAKIIPVTLKEFVTANLFTVSNATKLRDYYARSS